MQPRKRKALIEPLFPFKVPPYTIAVVSKKKGGAAKVRKPILGRTRFRIRQFAEAGGFHTASAVLLPLISEALVKEAAEEKTPIGKSPYFKVFASVVGGATPAAVKSLTTGAYQRAKFKGIEWGKWWGRQEIKDARFNILMSREEEQSEFYKTLYTFFDRNMDPVMRTHALERWLEDWTTLKRLESGRRLSFRIEKQLEQESLKDLRRLISFIISTSDSPEMRRRGRLYETLNIDPSKPRHGMKFPREFYGIIPIQQQLLTRVYKNRREKERVVSDAVAAFIKRFKPKTSWDALAYSLFLMRIKENADLEPMQAAINKGHDLTLSEQEISSKVVPFYLTRRTKELEEEARKLKRERKAKR